MGHGLLRPPLSILELHHGRSKMPQSVILGEPPEERNDDWVLRARRAVRNDPLNGPDEPMIVFFQRFDSEPARARPPPPPPLLRFRSRPRARAPRTRSRPSSSCSAS